MKEKTTSIVLMEVIIILILTMTIMMMFKASLGHLFRYFIFYSNF